MVEGQSRLHVSGGGLDKGGVSVKSNEGKSPAREAWSAAWSS